MLNYQSVDQIALRHIPIFWWLYWLVSSESSERICYVWYICITHGHCQRFYSFSARLIHIFQTQSYYALLMELCHLATGGWIIPRVWEMPHESGILNITSLSNICWRWNIPNTWVMWQIRTFTNPWNLWDQSVCTSVEWTWFIMLAQSEWTSFKWAPEIPIIW